MWPCINLQLTFDLFIIGTHINCDLPISDNFSLPRYSLVVLKVTIQENQILTLTLSERLLNIHICKVLDSGPLPPGRSPFGTGPHQWQASVCTCAAPLVRVVVACTEPSPLPPAGPPWPAQNRAMQTAGKCVSACSFICTGGKHSHACLPLTQNHPSSPCHWASKPEKLGTAVLNYFKLSHRTQFLTHYHY